MAAEDNRREDEQAANRAREAAEQKAGIPKLERTSAARMEKIRDGANAELAELDERRHAVQARRRRKEAEEEQRHAAEVAATRESLRVPA
jgi:hypothetical protein